MWRPREKRAALAHEVGISRETLYTYAPVNRYLCNLKPG